MDCEMVYTVWGTAVARVTMVDIHFVTVLDAVIRPQYDVIDCNTRFSGITIDQLNNAPLDFDNVTICHPLNTYACVSLNLWIIMGYRLADEYSI